MKSQQYSDYFGFHKPEEYPRTSWMIFYEEREESHVRLELAHPKKVQQCECCGKPVYEESWALKIGGKNYYRYYLYLCKQCHHNAPKIIKIWKEMGEPSHNWFSQKLMEAFRRFRVRLVEDGLVVFASSNIT